jgi:hypothetical protein
MLRTSRTISVLVVTGLLAGCTASAATAEPNDAAFQSLSVGSSAHGAGLVQFDACAEFLEYVIGHAIDLVGPYGLPGSEGPIWFDGRRAGEDALAASEESVGGESAPDFSETNVQVEGVDEPDLAKSDGERIVLISDGELIVVDVTGEAPRVTGRLQTKDFSIQNLFLTGDKVLLFGSAWGSHPLPVDGRDIAVAAGGTPTVQILEVDISGEPGISRTMTVDGAFVSGRMVDDTVRLVLTSGPVGFEWSYPEGSGLQAEREAIEKNQEIVRESTEENWIPYYVVTDEDGRVTDEGTLFDCERATHPDVFSGLDMLSVVTIDLGQGLEVVDATGVLARGSTVYSSGDSLYVATQTWDDWVWVETGEETSRPDGPVTEIHRFDTSDPTVASYVASGSVDGYLLNQFAMDEHEDMLRVASTTTPNGWGSAPDSDSRITVLRTIGDSLVPVGMVEGLGKTEQIYSVRFMGDTAYVVTFRQTDPLYTIDLTDPRQPVRIGELKIPGYSAYLHPVSEGVLLGVGQDATETGQVLGTQVSTFDVSDMADPKRIDTYTLSEGTSSQAEYDHHAFLFWEGLAMLPVMQWGWDGKKEDVFNGAVGLEIDESGGIVEAGKLEHPGAEIDGWDYHAQILRSFVVGESVYTISTQGIMKSSLDGLDEQAWLDF